MTAVTESVVSSDMTPNATQMLDAIWNDEVPAPAAPSEPPQPPKPPVEHAPAPDRPAEAPPDEGAAAPDVPEALGLPDEFFEPEVPDAEQTPPIEGEEVPIPQGMDEKQRHAFEQLAFDRRELKRQNAESQKRLTELEEQSNSANILGEEKLKEQIGELENKLGQYNLAETAAFKKEFEIPYQERGLKALKYLTTSGLDDASARALLNRALQTQDLNARIDMFNEEAPQFSGMLGVIFDEIDSIRTRRAETLKKWRDHKAANDETQKREQQRETLVMSDKLTIQAIEQAASEGNFMYRKAKNSEAWNQEVDSRIQAASAVLRKGDMAEMARYIVDGLAGRRLREMFVTERQKRVTVENQLGAIRGARPGVAGSTTSSSGANGKKETRSSEDILTDIWGTAG